MAAAAAKSFQSCPTLCDPIDGSPSGSPVPGILQTRTLEWVAISSSNACMLSRFSHVWLCATPWTAAHQTPLSMEFSRQEYWSGLPFPSLFLMWTIVFSSLCWSCHNIASVFMFCFFGGEACEILAPRPGIEPATPALSAHKLSFSTVAYWCLSDGVGPILTCRILWFVSLSHLHF